MWTNPKPNHPFRTNFSEGLLTLKGGWRCLGFGCRARRRNRAIPSVVLTGFGNKARQPKNGNPKGEGRWGVVPALLTRSSSARLHSLARALAHAPAPPRAIPPF